MAYMSQEKKAKIAAMLKKAVPADWKWSLAVRHHSTIVMTISSAPVDLVADYANGMDEPHRSFVLRDKHVDVNPFYWKEKFSPAHIETFQKIFEALNLDNHDRSDSMTDYHDVGHYVNLTIGRWDKPFVLSYPAKAPAKRPQASAASI